MSSAEPSGGSGESPVEIIGPIIEVATIDKRHDTSVLLELFGTEVILRLAVDPLQTGFRGIETSGYGRSNQPIVRRVRREEIREIGWAKLPDHLDRCEEIPITINEHRITENAAIGVMFLLIHELEGAVLTSAFRLAPAATILSNSRMTEPVQVEVSGIKVGKRRPGVEPLRSEVRADSRGRVRLGHHVPAWKG